MKRIRRSISEATKYKMRIAKLGKRNPMFGKHHNEVSKHKISQKMLEYWRTIPQ